MNVGESAENYLETIYIQALKRGVVRSVDVSNALGFSKPSVSIAVRQLRENGYIRLDDDKFITLTDKGLQIAQKMYERHEAIASVLIDLGVSEETAYEDSCKIEHVISEESFRRIVEHHKAKDHPIK